MSNVLRKIIDSKVAAVVIGVVMMATPTLTFLHLTYSWATIFGFLAHFSIVIGGVIIFILGVVILSLTIEDS